MNEFCAIPPKISSEENMTAATYRSIFFRIQNMAMNTMKWNGLPEGVDQMLIEKYLFYYGAVAFFKDEILDRYMVLPVATQYTFDVNGLPTSYEVIGFMGYRRKLNNTDSVIIWNNYSLCADVGISSLFATRLTETRRTIDVHMQAHRIGKILSVPENKKNSMQALIKRVKNFMLYTIASQDLVKELGGIKEINMETTYITDKLDLHHNNDWIEVYDYFGIDSTPDKKERVVMDEISVQTSVAEVNRNARLNPRKEACEKINNMFGLDISVESNMISVRMKEGEMSGNVYNDPKDSNGDIDE